MHGAGGRGGGGAGRGGRGGAARPRRRGLFPAAGEEGGKEKQQGCRNGPEGAAARRASRRGGLEVDGHEGIGEDPVLSPVVDEEVAPVADGQGLDRRRPVGGEGPVEEGQAEGDGEGLRLLGDGEEAVPVRSGQGDEVEGQIFVEDLDEAEMIEEVGRDGVEGQGVAVDADRQGDEGDIGIGLEGKAEGSSHRRDVAGAVLEGLGQLLVVDVGRGDLQVVDGGGLAQGRDVDSRRAFGAAQIRRDDDETGDGEEIAAGLGELADLAESSVGGEGADRRGDDAAETVVGDELPEPFPVGAAQGVACGVGRKGNDVVVGQGLFGAEIEDVGQAVAVGIVVAPAQAAVGGDVDGSVGRSAACLDGRPVGRLEDLGRSRDGAHVFDDGVDGDGVGAVADETLKEKFRGRRLAAEDDGPLGVADGDDVAHRLARAQPLGRLPGQGEASVGNDDFASLEGGVLEVDVAGGDGIEGHAEGGPFRQGTSSPAVVGRDLPEVHRSGVERFRPTEGRGRSGVGREGSSRLVGQVEDEGQTVAVVVGGRPGESRLGGDVEGSVGGRVVSDGGKGVEGREVAGVALRVQLGLALDAGRHPPAVDGVSPEGFLSRGPVESRRRQPLGDGEAADENVVDDGPLVARDGLPGEGGRQGDVVGVRPGTQEGRLGQVADGAVGEGLEADVGRGVDVGQVRPGRSVDGDEAFSRSGRGLVGVAAAPELDGHGVVVARRGQVDDDGEGRSRRNVDGLVEMDRVVARSLQRGPLAVDDAEARAGSSGLDAGVDRDVGHVVDASGVEGDGLDPSLLDGGEDVGHPGPLPSALGGRVGMDPAQGVVLVDALEGVDGGPDVDGSRVEDGVLVGEVEIASLSPGVAPAVLDDPGAVPFGSVEGVEVLPRIGVVPADDGDGVVGPADGQAVGVAGGDEGGAGGAVEIRREVPVPRLGIAGVDAHRGGSVEGDGPLDVFDAGLLVARVAVVVKVVDRLQAPRERRGAVGDLLVGGFRLVDGARPPGQKGRGTEVVAAQVHEGLKGQGRGDVSEAGKFGRLVDAAEVSQVHLGVVGAGDAGPEGRRLQRGHGGEGPAGAVGSLIADGRRQVRFPEVEGGGEPGPLLSGRGEEALPGQVAQVDGRGDSAPLGLGRPLRSRADLVLHIGDEGGVGRGERPGPGRQGGKQQQEEGGKGDPGQTVTRHSRTLLSMDGSSRARWPGWSRRGYRSLRRRKRRGRQSSAAVGVPAEQPPPDADGTLSAKALRQTLASRGLKGPISSSAMPSHRVRSVQERPSEEM